VDNAMIAWVHPALEFFKGTTFRMKYFLRNSGNSEKKFQILKTFKKKFE
jgi:hypothetical protein